MEELGFSLISEPILFHAWSYVARDKSAHRVYFVYLLELPDKIKFKSLEEPGGIEFIWATRDDILKADIMVQQKEFLVKALDYKIDK
jgi:8-oxo-dGTP pyrophosphatase MutT (NUDIX family)